MSTAAAAWEVQRSNNPANIRLLHQTMGTKRSHRSTSSKATRRLLRHQRREAAKDLPSPRFPRMQRPGDYTRPTRPEKQRTVQENASRLDPPSEKLPKIHGSSPPPTGTQRGLPRFGRNVGQSGTALVISNKRAPRLFYVLERDDFSHLQHPLKNPHTYSGVTRFGGRHNLLFIIAARTVSYRNTPLRATSRSWSLRLFILPHPTPYHCCRNLQPIQLSPPLQPRPIRRITPMFHAPELLIPHPPQNRPPTVPS